MKPAVRLAPALVERVPGLALGVVLLEGLAIAREAPDLASALEACAERVKGETDLEGLARLTEVVAMRAAFRATGTDPSRYRPSAEALLRRVLQGKGVPRINAAVDANTLGSLTFRLPMGAYDADRVKGEATCRIGEAGEGWTAIGGKRVDGEGKILLADAAGPFGSPYTDAAGTAVTEETRRLLLVIFSPPGLPGGRLEEALAFTAATMVSHCGGAVTAHRIVAG
jgi:DNA/RNA-binding domain of Phe-tRNA-synthetase-like protein